MKSDQRPTVFDPIRQKRVALTPEERVRQAVVRFLLIQLGYPPSRLANEYTITVGKPSTLILKGKVQADGVSFEAHAAVTHNGGNLTETADSILLYAANQPVFVVDTYTHRILSRHQLIDENAGYSDIQELFMDNLEADAHLFNEYHALLVRVGNRFCKKQRPDCDTCPLAGL